jgi:hypothetical protein
MLAKCKCECEGGTYVVRITIQSTIQATSIEAVAESSAIAPPATLQPVRTQLQTGIESRTHE